MGKTRSWARAWRGARALGGWLIAAALLAAASSPAAADILCREICDPVEGSDLVFELAWIAEAGADLSIWSTGHIYVTDLGPAASLTIYAGNTIAFPSPDLDDPIVLEPPPVGGWLPGLPPPGVTLITASSDPGLEGSTSGAPEVDFTWPCGSGRDCASPPEDTIVVFGNVYVDFAGLEVGDIELVAAESVTIHADRPLTFTPEPGTALLLGLGIGALALDRRRGSARGSLFGR